MIPKRNTNFDKPASFNSLTVSVYDLFLQSGMKVLKGKTVYKINGLIGIFNISGVLAHKHAIINFVVHTQWCGRFPN